MGIKITTEYMEDELLCPKCGESYLHHGTVEVFSCGEDAPTTRVSTVENRKTTVEMVPSVGCANPSRRRHGLRIAMDCEHCGGGIGYLNIYQHKGYTYMDWTLNEK